MLRDFLITVINYIVYKSYKMYSSQTFHDFPPLLQNTLAWKYSVKQVIRTLPWNNITVD